MQLATGVSCAPLRCTGFRHGGLTATRVPGLGFQLEAPRNSEFRRVSQRFA
jgi:hypothetical protein